MILGITGPTGSGKTTLLQAFQGIGGTVLDCDAIYHRLLKEDKALLSAIEARFPGVVEDGELDRKKLGNLVFSDHAALLELNRITHAAVKQEVVRLLEEAPKLAAIDAIGLFEGGLAELCDVTVAVTAPEDARVARLMAREAIPEEYARKRIAAQKSAAWFSAKCDFTLENTGEKEAFFTKSIAFFRSIGIIE